jgi:predicted nucleotidyltransferase
MVAQLYSGKHQNRCRKGWRLNERAPHQSGRCYFLSAALHVILWSEVVCVRNVSPNLVQALRIFFAAYPEVVAVYLFGSFGTEYEHPESDLDLGVVFRGRVKLRHELEIEADLSTVIKSDRVDFVNLGSAPVALQFRALSEGMLVYEGDYILNSNFIEHVLREYRDYSYRYARFAEESRKALREEYS